MKTLMIRIAILDVPLNPDLPLIRLALSAIAFTLRAISTLPQRSNRGRKARLVIVAILTSANTCLVIFFKVHRFSGTEKNVPSTKTTVCMVSRYPKWNSLNRIEQIFATAIGFMM